MRRILLLFVCSFIVLFVLTNSVPAQIPRTISYQGRLTDMTGKPVGDNIYSIKFRIIDSLDTEIWSSDGFLPIQVKDGLFNHYLGSSNPLPESLGEHGELRLGIIIGLDSEILTDLSSTSFAFSSLSAQHANASDTAAFSSVAERVIQGRDLYHQIMDINPNSITVVPFVARAANPTVTLYLYGSGYQGPLSNHTHDGLNAHSHDISGTVASASVSHTHSYSGTSGTASASHTHTGSIGSTDLAHLHSGTTGSTSLAHSHTGATNNDAAHHHDFLFQGVNTHFYLVHTNDYEGLTAHGTYNCKATGSVAPGGSAHSHEFTTNSALGTHSHTFGTSSSLGTHNHSLTISSTSPSHSHSYSGTTGTNGITHSHTFTGSASSTGTGLEGIGIAAGTLPSNVYVYIDGSPVAGPFDGNFASGGLDLSSYISGVGEHTIEIREEGGSGGRISYNLFVE
ncbi:MAG: hypothetical protein AB1746_14500 [Candidatus Zixiibacteriota bacterium]